MPIRSPAYFLQHAHPPGRFLLPYFGPVSLVLPFCKTFSHIRLSPLACCRFLSSCPAAFALFTGHRVPASNLVRLASVSFLFCLFPRSVFVVSFWRALSFPRRFPIRLATSLCLSAVSPCPSFPRLYKRPISALLRLPPCPAIFCSPILVPSPLFCFAFLQNIVT